MWCHSQWHWHVECLYLVPGDPFTWHLIHCGKQDCLCLLSQTKIQKKSVSGFQQWERPSWVVKSVWHWLLRVLSSWAWLVLCFRAFLSIHCFNKTHYCKIPEQWKCWTLSPQVLTAPGAERVHWDSFWGENESSWQCIYDEINYDFVRVFQVMISLEYKYKETEFNDITNTLGDFEDTRLFFVCFFNSWQWRDF